MNDVLIKLNTIIAEQLPAVTAGELKKYLDDAEKNKRLLEDKTKDAERYYKLSSEFKEERDKLKEKLELLAEKEKQLDIKEKLLVSKELSIETRTRNFELELDNVKINSLERERLTVVNLVEKVFGHPSVTIERNTSKGVSAYNQNGGYWTSTSDSDSETETRTESKK